MSHRRHYRGRTTSAGHTGSFWMRHPRQQFGLLRPIRRHALDGLPARVVLVGDAGDCTVMKHPSRSSAMTRVQEDLVALFIGEVGFLHLRGGRRWCFIESRVISVGIVHGQMDQFSLESLNVK